MADSTLDLSKEKAPGSASQAQAQEAEKDSKRVFNYPLVKV